MTEYRLSELTLTPDQLFFGINFLYPATYAYKFDLEDGDIIYFYESDGITAATIPDVQSFIDGYADYVAQQAAIQTAPRKVPSKLTTADNSFTFLTRENTCVSIPTGSNSVASNLDSTKMENMVSLGNDTFINSVATLPVYKYNIVGQDVNIQRVGFTGSDWNSVMEFSAKDSTLTNVELMDVIGVLLTCVKNLDERVKQLETPPV